MILIMKIYSNRTMINLFINETVISSIFIWFLKIIKNLLFSNNDEIIFLLDKNMIYRSKETKEI